MAGVDDENNVGDGNGKIDFDDERHDKGDDDGDGNGDVDAASAKIHQKLFPQGPKHNFS